MDANFKTTETMTKTKEEIIRIKVQPTPQSVTIKGAYEAMDEYARIEAIEFMKWVESEGFSQEEKVEIFRTTVYRSINYNDDYTIEELYNLYKTSQCLSSPSV